MEVSLMYSFWKHNLTIPRYFPFAKVLLIGLGVIFISATQSHELSRCGRALSQTILGTFEGTLRPESCPVTSRLIQWLQLQKPGTSFPKMAVFFQENPHWPLKDKIQSLAEDSLKGDENPRILTKWFDNNPPLSVKGATFYARALMAEGRKNAARKAVHDAWVNMEMNEASFKLFWKEFKKLLTQEAHQQRVDSLLKEEKIALARAMFAWLNPEHQALADARIALIQQAGDVDTKLTRIPKSLIKDPGLQYDRIKWHRRKENNLQMMKLLQEAKPPSNMTELWWRERNLLVRRLIDERRYKETYDIIKNHGLLSGENFAHAEWLAGWIALRMLHQPALALKHFRNLRAKVKSPISVARAAYWAGRAAAMMGERAEAKNWEAEAKSHPGTYYGQVALRGNVLGPTPPLHSKRPKVDATLHKKFEEREFVQAIRLLCAVGAKKMIEPFGIKLAQELTHPGEQVLLIELAARECGPYYGILATKKLPLKTVPLIEAAYPLLHRHYHKIAHKANMALVHAIIRQESRFKADAMSPVGAQGLMQLMPKTALQTAQKKKLRLGSLYDPAVNIPLGCAYLRELLDKYNGSLILAIAAYNAGTTAVDTWIQKYGDPRTKGADLVDWIEKIDYAETRNYVQRVLENYAYYAQLLGA